MPDQNSVTVPVTQEELEVRSRTVDTQRTVRVRKEVIHDPVHVELEALRESVEIHRVAIGRVVDSAPAVRQEGDVTVVPVLEEREVVVKQLVLVEEVRITRKRDAVPLAADVTLRKEQVTVERYDADSGEWISEEERSTLNAVSKRSDRV